MTRFSLSALFIVVGLGVGLGVTTTVGVVLAQEQKPVPKDSVRIYVPGCAKGYVFTAVRATEDTPRCCLARCRHRTAAPRAAYSGRAVSRVCAGCQCAARDCQSAIKIVSIQ